MTENTTLIPDLYNFIDHKIDICPVSVNKDDVDDVQDFLMDGSTDLEQRIKILGDFYKRYGESFCMEIVNRIATLYQFSGTKILEKYLYRICVRCKISPFLKIIAAKSLCSFNPKEDIGYNALSIVCKNMKNVATPCQIDAVCVLMMHKSYKIKSKNFFCSIINDLKLNCDFRYKTILSLENKDIPEKDYFIYRSTIQFFNNNKNMTLYRIVAGQYLIQKCKLVKIDRSSTELTLMSFAQDPDLDYNLRADAADVILRLGSHANKITARKIIMMLGRQDGNVRTIFDNAQNVHVDEIEKSVLQALEFLSGIEMKTVTGISGTPFITFEYVKKQIDNMLDEEKPKKKDQDHESKDQDHESKDQDHESKDQDHDIKQDKIHIALNRIYMDRALYSNYNCSLLHILLKIWTYITSHKSEKEMKQRLLEELVDMSGTCSSGFASRLVNVISGFGEFNFHISWKDQIIANFAGRLNARARNIINDKKIFEHSKFYSIKACKNNIKDNKKHRLDLYNKLEEFQGSVLEEMMINSDDYGVRKNFLKFFRKNMLSIRQELYSEFKEYIQDSDFDLYFRAALSSYETGGYV
jgi:hypothetical protein